MKKLAVHLHIYYTEQLPELLKYLHNLKNQDYDLFVTMVADNKDIVAKIKAEHPAATIWQVENRGYDIGPFIDFLHKIDLDNYEYVLKLHTKGKKSKNYTFLNHRRFDNALWGRILWDSLLKTPERLAENLQIMDNNHKFGLLGSKYCLTSAQKDYEKLLPKINTELEKMGFLPVERLSFIAGSMFLARAKCLSPLKHYHISDFQITNSNIKEGTLAHIVERLFGVLGQEIYALEYGYYGIEFIFIVLKRFFYQQKTTKHGTQVIKICKLPVYFKKLKEV